MVNIVIPYYNNSKTIERALHSIAMQTAARKVIVTIVDDCSTERVESRFPLQKDDGTYYFPKITTYWYITDELNRLFPTLSINYLKTEKNGGPAAARNLGIKNCFCDWIMFMDADDALASPCAIEAINTEVQLKHPDVLVTRFQYQGNREIRDMPLLNGTWLHGKVFKTLFLQDKHILLPEIRANEDSPFVTIIYNFAEEVVELDFVTYLWLNNKESITRSDEDFHGNHLADFVKGRLFAYQKLRELNDEECLMEEVSNTFLLFYWNYNELYSFKPEKVPEYVGAIHDYCNTIEIKRYFKDESFVKYIKEKYWETQKKPTYGAAFPAITVEEFCKNIIF